MEEDLKEMKITIEREKEEHEALMIEKQKEYEETEQQLTADNQEVCAYTSVLASFACTPHSVTHCTSFVIH